ncbi:hypothetical protein [Agarivorans gilvus]|uniref:Uncharacterized protein n=1 Tax=Agarivorans gilvus TaxID=680279 RepID=A0ABQ1I6S9_9ALTE|nr:hypothetical protein [Agarivorans gilvus]GGB22282.1 hypothetical protein GCM10007414_39570 [Agarivorans gilvus]
MKAIPLLFSMLLCMLLAWFLSAKYLGEVVHYLNPELSHEDFSSVWFNYFVGIESIVVVTFGLAVYLHRRSKKKFNNASN